MNKLLKVFNIILAPSLCSVACALFAEIHILKCQYRWWINEKYRKEEYYTFISSYMVCPLSFSRSVNLTDIHLLGNTLLTIRSPVKTFNLSPGGHPSWKSYTSTSLSIMCRQNLLRRRPALGLRNKCVRARCKREAEGSRILNICRWDAIFFVPQTD